MGLRLDKSIEIPGWMLPAELHFLAEVAEKSKVIIEVGSYQGKSTRALADNAPDDSRIYAVDSWNYYITALLRSDDITFNQFYLNLYHYIKAGKVIPVRKTWEEYQPTELADFIFIDGHHTYDSVAYDINKALFFLKEGGIIAGHDYAEYFPGVVKAVHERFGKFGLAETIWWVQR